MKGEYSLKVDNKFQFLWPGSSSSQASQGPAEADDINQMKEDLRQLEAALNIVLGAPNT